MAMLYSVGFLRLIRCGLELNNYLVYAFWAGMTGYFIPWSLYRSEQVQHEYNELNYNPISASLSFIWKLVPQVNIFSQIYQENDDIKQELKRKDFWTYQNR